jgi:UDP-4-keto-D-FucNAc 4-reductase
VTEWPADWSRRVVVTGANGFVGRRLVAHLLGHHMAVCGLTRRRETGLLDSHVVDYGDVRQLANAFADASVVFHLAARAHQLDGPDAETAYERANVFNTQCVAEACLQASVKRLVFVSSIGVHGNRSNAAAFTEADPPAPAEPYAVSKLKAERLLSRVLADTTTDFVILRPPLVYGAGCPGNFKLLLSMATRAPIVPLVGITAPRRFIYVGNLVDALRMAAQHPAASRKTFVLGDARDVTVSEIAQLAMAQSGRSPWVGMRVPPIVLGAIATVAGKRAALDKLMAPLQVNPQLFCASTGWSPPFDPSVGLREAVSALLEIQRHQPEVAR